jgi:hypothetical protein
VFKLCRLFFRHAVTLWLLWRSATVLSCDDYTSVTLISLLCQGLQRADYSAVTRNSLRSEQFCRIDRHRSGNPCARSHTFPTRDVPMLLNGARWRSCGALWRASSSSSRLRLGSGIEAGIVPRSLPLKARDRPATGRFAIVARQWFLREERESPARRIGGGVSACDGGRDDGA